MSKFAIPRLAGLLMLVAPLAWSVGCDGGGDRWTRDRPPVYPVSGQVILNGKPLEQATVTFQPTDPKGKAGSAVTDAEGRFEAMTFDAGDGLTEGSHRVAVKKTVMVDSSGNVVSEIREPGSVTEKSFVPAKYSDFEKSGLEITVSSAEDNELAPFEITE
ncbi:hypothetical protein FF011L_05810 [Roseimaritima multifibrata]|uniref:Nickel uptake substrate-specific transmembrane region n=1 Tax=Roseimaritima multifibrata TaxID=1930274 RepID=A0A517MAD3_9BACT|nr:carboxypeptidase-like regulatory domain-containing protein [Roseimaritima multifibrata]QDS91845.1 hypothetical protein FF011L_05810 [Roseimaritima multifibrata]